MLGNSEKLFSKVVGDIYRASYHPEHWPVVLDGVRRLTFSLGASLLYRNTLVNKTSAVYARGWPEKAVKEYNELWGEKDPLLEYSVEECGVPLGKVVPNYALVPKRRDLKALAPEYWEWVEKNGVYYNAGVTIFYEDTRQVLLAVQRPRIQGKWNQKYLELIEELVPHIRQSMTIHEEFVRLRAQEKAIASGLNDQGSGVVLFDMMAEPVFINDTARVLIESYSVLQFHPHKLFATNADDNKKLQRALTNAINCEEKDISFKTQYLGLRPSRFGAPVPIMIKPVRSNDPLLGSASSSVRAMLVIGNINQPEISFEALEKVYGMTRAEVRLAKLLVEGHEPKKIAQLLEVSINTVRSQMRSIFKKTDTRRQAELVKLLLSGPFREFQ